MTDIYTCGKCGVVAELREQLCDPREVQDKTTYCDTTPETGEMCEELKERSAYVCGSCGRPAKQAELLCTPLMTG
jgi:ribosomal protein S27AE